MGGIVPKPTTLCAEIEVLSGHKRPTVEEHNSRDIAPIELVVRSRRCLAGVIQFVATVPIRWKP